MHGIDEVAVVADDILIFGKGDNMKEAQCQHYEALLWVLQRAREYNIKLNKDKLQLHLLELVYMVTEFRQPELSLILPKWQQSNRCPFLSQYPMIADF